MSPHRTLHRLVVPLTCSLKYLSVSQLVCKSGPYGCSDVDRAFASCRLLKHTGGCRLANSELGSPVRYDQLSAERASAYPNQVFYLMRHQSHNATSRSKLQTTAPNQFFCQLCKVKNSWDWDENFCCCCCVCVYYCRTYYCDNYKAVVVYYCRI